MPDINMAKAINMALNEAMERDNRVVVMGEDVGPDEGVFRVTEGLHAKYGDKRVIDTPLAESGIVGTAIGMAIYGLRPVAEIQFSSFEYYAYHQIEMHAARFRNRTRGRLSVPMVLRCPSGGGIRAIEHHSESREAIYAHSPGLKVVMPSGPRSARALLHAAIQDPDPVIYYEPKALYRLFREDVPEAIETYPIGRAQVVQEGKEITLISYGATVRAAIDAAEILEDEDSLKPEIIDLLSIAPLDTDTIVNSVRKTGRAVVIHEGPRTCGIGSEVIARINEHAIEYLEAPIKRITGYDTPIPYFARERAYIPDADKIVAAVREVLSF
ncbi:MAG: alpha-ketoacid dehydrogenase subunit beta [Candidatus Obscuribacterales bacterium]|jgi:pyruvate dehydrogenase E1 component beta subunit|nr:alpha-ketoacid dehydrogenase subunit beta [Candidatus Obscuribacterales bacterium]